MWRAMFNFAGRLFGGGPDWSGFSQRLMERLDSVEQRIDECERDRNELWKKIAELEGRD